MKTRVKKKKTFRSGTDERDGPLAQIGAQFCRLFRSSS